MKIASLREVDVFLNKLGQFGIILGVLFLGEFLQIRFNLPVPATILGMIILLFLMITRIVKLKWVEDIGNTLLDNLSILFIPAGVGIVRELDLFKGHMIGLSVIVLISTTVVIVVTGYTIQVLEVKKRGKNI